MSGVMELRIVIKYSDGYWWLHSETDGFVFGVIGHTDLGMALADLPVVWKRINELSPGQLPPFPASATGASTSAGCSDSTKAK